MAVSTERGGRIRDTQILIRFWFFRQGISAKTSTARRLCCSISVTNRNRSFWGISAAEARTAATRAGPSGRYCTLSSTSFKTSGRSLTLSVAFIEFPGLRK